MRPSFPIGPSRQHTFDIRLDGLPASLFLP